MQEISTATKLRKVRCPVCNKEIVDLKRHLINIHRWDNRDARLARQNLGLNSKVIFDKLHYQRKKTNATSAVSENTLPIEEETTMDKMECIWIPVDMQPEFGTEEPFSTAGSSVTRTRYNYTEEELDTINRQFEDLITGTMTIHELDVKERFQKRPALQYLELMSELGTRKLTDKVRTERKAYKA